MFTVSLSHNRNGLPYVLDSVQIRHLPACLETHCISFQFDSLQQCIYYPLLLRVSRQAGTGGISGVLCSWSHQAIIKMLAGAVISSEASGPLPTSLAVDRVQFLAVGLRPSASRDGPVTRPPEQHSFMLLQGHFKNLLHIFYLSNLWSFQKTQSD